MLMGQTIKVIMKDDLSFKDGNWGEANLRTNEITLQADASGHNRNRDQVEDIFIHELVHFILDLGGDTKLSEDESFVKRFSSLLHQALKTADYSDDNSPYGVNPQFKMYENDLYDQITSLRDENNNLTDRICADGKRIDELKEESKRYEKEREIPMAVKHKKATTEAGNAQRIEDEYPH